MKITLYGINNCDTVKKALKWLITENISHEFYDFKKQSLTPELTQLFVSLSNWEQLLNKRSTTYKNLADNIKNNLSDDIAFEQVLLQPTLLKRPLLLIENTQQGDQLHLGFKAQVYQDIFKAINNHD